MLKFDNSFKINDMVKIDICIVLRKNYDFILVRFKDIIFFIVRNLFID